MAPKFKMDAKTFLSFKTCKFNYFKKFHQDCFNLANFNIQNGRKIQYGRFFAQNYDFLLAESLSGII
jgi:hypothetical protein